MVPMWRQFLSKIAETRRFRWPRGANTGEERKLRTSSRQRSVRWSGGECYKQLHGEKKDFVEHVCQMMVKAGIVVNK